jgi:hypothetical protein
VATIAMTDPKSFIIEMIWKKRVRAKFLAIIQTTCPHYAVWSGIINSAVVADTSRTRFYILGINVVKAGLFAKLKTIFC